MPEETLIAPLKYLLAKVVAALQELLLKIQTELILPPSLAPPLRKVSQVEIEAGDSEGRLPLAFSPPVVSCPWSVVMSYY